VLLGHNSWLLMFQVACSYCCNKAIAKAALLPQQRSYIENVRPCSCVFHAMVCCCCCCC
jgi:hypothetical protein